MAVWPAPSEPKAKLVKPVATDNGITTGDGKLHSWTDLSALTLPELRSLYTTQTKELHYKGEGEAAKSRHFLVFGRPCGLESGQRQKAVRMGRSEYARPAVQGSRVNAERVLQQARVERTSRLNKSWTCGADHSGEPEIILGGRGCPPSLAVR